MAIDLSVACVVLCLISSIVVACTPFESFPPVGARGMALGMAWSFSIICTISATPAAIAYYQLRKRYAPVSKLPLHFYAAICVLFVWTTIWAFVPLHEADHFEPTKLSSRR